MTTQLLTLNSLKTDFHIMSSTSNKQVTEIHNSIYHSAPNLGYIFDKCITFRAVELTR